MIGRRAAPPPQRHARPRRDDVDRRPLLRADPRGPGRERGQGRAAGHGRRRQGLGTAVLERRRDDLPRRQCGEAVAGALAARAAGSRGAASARRRGRRLPAKPPSRARRRAGPRRGRAARAQPTAGLLLVRRVRPRRPPVARAGLRRADAGGRRADLDDRRTGPARCPHRLVADRPGHRDVGRARRAGGAAGARTDRRGGHRRRVPLRDGARLYRLPPDRLPGRRHRAARAGHDLPDGRAVSGVSHARRRADDRRRQRPAVRGDLRRPGRSGARRRPAFPDQSRPRREPGDALRDPRRRVAAG